MGLTAHPGHPLGLWRPLSRKGDMDGVSHRQPHAKVTCPLHLLSHPGKDSIIIFLEGSMEQTREGWRSCRM